MDTQLVNAARAGDARAIDALFTAAMDRARKQAMRLMYPKHAAGVDDVVQEAMLQVHQHLRDFKGDSSFATWLHVVVLNCTRMYMRKHSKDYLVFDLELVDALPASVRDDADAQLLRRVQREKLDRALQTLSPKRRRAFLGFAEQGYTLAELSVMYGTKASSLKSHIFRARHDLQARLSR